MTDRAAAAPGDTVETITIEHVELRLAHPDDLPIDWIGSDELPRQLRAAWSVFGERDQPMNPRVIGRPGLGKTTLAYATARSLGREVYLYQATMDTRPEDLLVQPVISPGGGIAYVASGLVTAMVRGGVAILDEGNRMPEKSWASLAPLLDDRRYVESVVAGIKVQAHPEFRIAVTMNEDASTFEVPEYIHSRLQPQIYIDFPDRETELAILRHHVPFGEEELVARVVDFLQRSHAEDTPTSVRDGINILRYAWKLAHSGAEGDILPRAMAQVLEGQRKGRSTEPWEEEEPDDEEEADAP